MDSREKPNPASLAALTLAGQLGMSIALPIVAGVWLGQYLDEKLGTTAVFLVLGVLLGLACGGYEAYRVLMKAATWKN